MSPEEITDLRARLLDDIDEFAKLARDADEPKLAAEWALVAKNTASTCLSLTQDVATLSRIAAPKGRS